MMASISFRTTSKEQACNLILTGARNVSKRFAWGCGCTEVSAQASAYGRKKLEIDEEIADPDLDGASDMYLGERDPDDE